MSEARAKRMREYRVGVFEHPRTRSVGLMAYTRWFNPEWEGCCLHMVDAYSGAEAKRAAMAEHRLLHMKP